jgi:hypothetical protein
MAAIAVTFTVPVVAQAAGGTTASLADIAAARAETWSCERQAGLPLNRASHLGHAGPAYRAWIVARWQSRLAMCSQILDRTITTARGWLDAIRAVQRAYPGSSWWLVSCSRGEGGHGGWVPNSGGSGAGGWMQYMEGTFWHDFSRALADLRARGYRVPAAAHSWYSPTGQAVAAGWAYGHERPAGKWVGGGC